MKSNISTVQKLQAQTAEYKETKKTVGREFRDELLSFKNWAALIVEKRTDQRLLDILAAEGLQQLGCNKLTINYLKYVYRDKPAELSPFDGTVLCKFRKYDSEKYGEIPAEKLFLKGKTQYFKEPVGRLTFNQFLNIFKSAAKVLLKDNLQKAEAKAEAAKKAEAEAIAKAAAEAEAKKAAEAKAEAEAKQAAAIAEAVAKATAEAEAKAQAEIEKIKSAAAAEIKAATKDKKAKKAEPKKAKKADEKKQKK